MLPEPDDILTVFNHNTSGEIAGLIFTFVSAFAALILVPSREVPMSLLYMLLFKSREQVESE